MFGMSMSELGIILLVVLVVMGPEKIPDAARMIGKAMREVRKASNLLRDAVMIDVDDKPKVARATPSFEANRATGTLTPAVRDPDPKLDVRVVKMNTWRGPQGVAECALQAARSAEPLREVYLHVPYDETI